LKLSKWKISLPIYPPDEVLDNSTRSEYMACMRLGFYKYGMRLGFGGKSWPIQIGLAYHKYREVVEKVMMNQGESMSDRIHEHGIEHALKGWEEPPIPTHPDARKDESHLNQARLLTCLDMARTRIELEQQTGSVVVFRAEDSFDLEFPFMVCHSCGWASPDPPEDGLEIEEGAVVTYLCHRCIGGGNILRSRHGGRVDQFIEFNHGLNIRDFKNTKWKDKNYEKKFSPNAQIQGYVWAGGQLSGRNFDGAVIETVHHLKGGSTIHQHYVEYSTGQQEQWVASQMMHEQFIRTAWARVEELGYLAFPQNTNSCFRFNKPCRWTMPCQMGSAFEIEKWLENNTIHSHWDFMNPDKEEAKV